MDNTDKVKKQNTIINLTSDQLSDIVSQVMNNTTKGMVAMQKATSPVSVRSSTLDAEPLAVKAERELMCKIQNADILARQLTNGKMVTISIGQAMKPYLGDTLTASINGKSITVPIDGKQHKIPIEYAPLIMQKVTFDDLKLATKTDVQAVPNNLGGIAQIENF